MKNFLLASFAIVAAAACGDSVSLGDEVEYWFDGDPSKRASKTEAVTLFETSGVPFTFAVDETTLFVSFMARHGPAVGVVMVKSCDLASCASTVRTLYEQSYPSVSDIPRQVLAISGSEIFFLSRDGLGQTYMAACPRSGCTPAPRELTPASASFVTVTDDDVYWIDGANLSRCSTKGCAAPAQRNLSMLAAKNGSPGSLISTFIAGDYAYVAGTWGIARIKRDLATDVDWVETSDVPVRGLAADASWVYFGMSTLAGELRRCPVTGCLGASEVVVSGQRWPAWLAVDDHSLYWFAFSAEVQRSRIRLRTAPLDQSAGWKDLLSEVPLDDTAIFMSSRHFFWTEYSSNGRMRIRMLAK